MYLITLLIAILAVAAIVSRRRTRSRMDVGGLGDDQVRRIETVGRIEVEDPLDLEEIRAAEQSFWEETWDEPEDG